MVLTVLYPFVLTVLTEHGRSVVEVGNHQAPLDVSFLT
jgi:hypothetical protein